MPNKDGTGPEGKGSMTGRGMGPCATKTTKAGPHGGGNKFGQMKVTNNFSVISTGYGGKYGKSDSKKK